jgi:hypothetical protein
MQQFFSLVNTLLKEEKAAKKRDLGNLSDSISWMAVMNLVSDLQVSARIA